METNFWSNEEVATLKEFYSVLGAAGLVGKLPGRSVKSIKCQARRQGLNVSRSVAEAIKRKSLPEIYSPWSEQDIKLLKSLYPTYGGSGLTDVFHERSAKSIRRKANELGIRMESELLTERKRELVRKENERKRAASGSDSSSMRRNNFSEYEKVSSIFSVGRRCQALFDGGFVQGD